ncbi:MAG: Calx-beta domain-containing protein, partial [Bacteroidota bacterium]
MKSFFRFTIILLLCIWSIDSKAQLSAGDIVIVGFNADASADEVALMALVDIPTTETFFVTDYPVTAAGGSTFDSSNGTNGSVQITPTATISAGTIFTLAISGSSGGVGVTGASVNTSTITGWTSTNPAGGAGDVFHIFQGSGLTTPTTFLFAFGTTSTMNDGAFDNGGNALSSTESFLGNGLVNGSTAVSLAGSFHSDNVIYNGTVSGSAVDLLAEITDRSNYSGNNTTTFDITVDGASDFDGGGVTTNPGFTVSGGTPEVTLSATTSPIAENGGTSTLTATTDIAVSADEDITITYTGTATNGVDYTGTTTITISSGMTTGSITITGLDDTRDDDAETIIATITATETVDIGTDDDETITITDDDAAPEISIGDVTLSEGDAGTVSFNFTVSMNRESNNTVTASFITNNGTATAGSDYTANSGTVSFTPGDVSETVTVIVAGDELVENSETFTVTLSSPGNGTIDDGTGIGTITNDDNAGFSIVESSGSTDVTEAGGTDTYTVVLDAEPASNVVISVSSGDTGEATVSTASLTFTNANWDTPQTVTVTGVDDDIIDGTQSVTITMAVVDASSNDFFDPLGNQTVSADNTDDDVAGFTIVESSGSTDVTEAGGTDTYTVVL